MNLNNRFFSIGVIAAIAVLTIAFAFAASGSGVIDQNAEGITVAASAVTTSSINYQGRLTDSAGEPLSGTYTMTFRLYEVASGGTALDTDSRSEDVTDGLFNTEIDFDPEYFDGRGLWLGITVGIDSEMSPRHELRSVPYALSLKPGANIVGASSVALQAESTHTAGSGIRGDVSATSGTNYGVVGESKSPDGYGGYFCNNEGGTGVYGKGGKSGGYFTTNQGGTSWRDKTTGVNVTTDYDYSAGVCACTSGDNSNGVHAYTTGDFSYGVQASTTGDNSSGVFALTFGDDSPGVMASIYGEDSPGIWAYSDKHYGVYGIGKSGGYFTTNQAGTGWSDKTAGVNATTAYDYSAGVQAHTTGDYSTGVDAVTTGDHSLGVQASTTGENSPGVDAYTTGDSSDGVSASAWGENSVGVRAYSVQGYGVYGKGKSGGFFTANQGGTGKSDKTAGVNATTVYDYSDGIQASTSGYMSTGVSASTSGYLSTGVSASTSGYNSNGVHVYTLGNYSSGVLAQTSGDYSNGVLARSTKYNAIYADTDRSDNKYGVKTPDKICAMSYDTGCADVAEYFPVAEDSEPGTVMVIGEDSKLQCSCTAYDTTVAGIVSTAPGVSLGTNETGNEGEKLIAVAGRVPCKVDASYAPIEPGDLLTTSNTPGHAMKATDPQIGTILGKALEPLDSGTGVIEVLVTLQ
ncbi:hypothetical protein C5S31_10975 [ANME-1 cluster archaeon GoMg2]|nr:hypothetical protein [ANME-1 cluster archaeon GoMg2]